MRWKYPMIISSKDYLAWEKEQLKVLRGHKNALADKKWLRIACDFYMPDARATDLSNKFESIADLLCHDDLQIISDDNCNILSEVSLVFRWIDRINPRCDVELL